MPDNTILPDILPVGGMSTPQDAQQPILETNQSTPSFNPFNIGYKFTAPGIGGVLSNIPKTKETIGVVKNRYNENDNWQKDDIRKAAEEGFATFDTSTTWNMDKEDSKEYDKISKFKDSFDANTQKAMVLDSEIKGILGQRSDDNTNTRQQRLDVLNEQYNIGNMSAQEYGAKAKQLLESAKVIDKYKEYSNASSEAMISTYSTFSGIDENILKDIQNNGGDSAVKKYVAKQLGTTESNVDSYVEKKMKDQTEMFKTKYGLDLNAAYQKEYSNTQGAIKAMDNIFSKAGYILSDDDKEQLNTTLSTNIEDPRKSNIAKSEIYKLNQEALISLKGGVFKLGEEKEDGENLWNRMDNVWNSPEYKLVKATIEELSQMDEFYTGGKFEAEKFALVIKKTPEFKQYTDMLTKNETILHQKTLEEKSPILGFINKPLSQFNVDVAEGGIYTENEQSKQKKEDRSAGGFSRMFGPDEAYALGYEGRKKFIDNLIDNADITQDVSSKIKDSKADTKGEKAVKFAASILTNIFYNPVGVSYSEGSKGFLKETIKNDPEYFTNKQKQYVQTVADISNMLVGKPSDVLVALGSVAAGQSLGYVGSAISKSTKLAPVIDVLAQATVNNPNSKIIRSASQIVYRGLSEMVAPANLSINTYAWSFSNTPGFSPLDVILDFGIGSMSRAVKIANGGFRLTDDVYDVYKTVGKSFKEGTEEYKNALRIGLSNEGLLPIEFADDILSSPTKVATENTLYYSELSKSPNYQAQIMSDAAKRMLERYPEQLTEFKSVYLPIRKDKYPAQYKLVSDGVVTEDKFILDVLNQEGALKLDNLAKYNFIKYEFDLNKNLNPIVKNIDEYFDSYKGMFGKDERIGSKADVLIERAKMQMVATSYGIYTNGKSRGIDQFNTIRKELESELVNMGADTSKLDKQHSLAKAMEDFDVVYGQGLGEQTKNAKKIRDNIPNENKLDLQQSVVAYVSDDTVSMENKTKLLEDMGFTQDEIIETITNGTPDDFPAKVMNKLSGIFKNGLYEISAEDYMKGVSSLLDSKIFTSNIAKNRFKNIVNTIMGIDAGTIKLNILTQEMRDIYGKLSPYLNIQSVDRKNLVLHDILNVVMLDKILHNTNNIENATDDIVKVLKNISEGMGHRVYGSLDTPIKNTLKKKLANISDREKFVKDNKLEGLTNKDDILAKLFGDNFRSFILGKKGAVNNEIKKITGQKTLLTDAEKVNSDIYKIVGGYVDSTEGMSTVINNTDGQLGLIGAADIIDDSKKTIEDVKNAVESNNKMNLLAQGIDVDGASKIVSTEDLIAKVEELSSIDLSKLISAGRYDDPMVRLMMKIKLGETNYSKWSEAVDIAKERRNAALDYIKQFAINEDGTVKLQQSIIVDGQEIRLRDVLNNMEYRITSDGLINTSNHDMVKYILEGADNSDGFVGDVFDGYTQGRNVEGLAFFKGKETPKDNFIELFNKVKARITEVSDVAIANDVMSRMIVGMPQYIEALSKNKLLPLDLIDSLAKHLLDLNATKATKQYVPIYDRALAILGDISDFTLKGSDSVRLKGVAKTIKNAQLSLMDSVINDAIAGGVKLTQEGFDNFIRKAFVGDSKTITANYFDGLFIETKFYDTLQKYGEDFVINTSANREGIIEDIRRFIGREDIKKILVAELGDDYTKIVKSLDDFSEGIPESILQKEFDKITNSNLPNKKTIDMFYGDVRNSAEIQRKIDENISETILDGLTLKQTSQAFDTTLVRSDILETRTDLAGKAIESIKKLTSRETKADAFQFMENMKNLDFLDSMNPIDGQYKINKFLYESELGKKLFEFKGNGYKQIIVDPNESYFMGGQVRLYEDIVLNKWSTAFRKYTQMFASAQSFASKDVEINNIIFKGYNSKTVVIDLEEGTNLYEVADVVLKDRKYGSQIFLKTFLNNLNQSLSEKIINTNRKGSNLIADFSNIFSSSKVAKQKLFVGSDGDYYRMIDAYIESVQIGRKKLGLGRIDKSSYDATIGKMLSIRGNGNTTQGALNKLEGLDGLWIGLDVNDINRLSEKMDPFVAEGSSRYLFNTFSNSRYSASLFNKIGKGFLKGEKNLSMGMYSMLFNPIASPQLFTQQALQNKIHALSRGLTEMAGVNLEHMDDVLKLFDSYRPFSLSQGQLQQNLLSASRESKGKGTLFNINTNRGLDKKLMAFSSQSLADRVSQADAMRTSMASAFLQYGHTAESANALLLKIADAGDFIAKSDGLVTFPMLAYKNEDTITKILTKKMAGSTEDEIATAVQNALFHKNNIGNLGEIVDNYYTKLGAFYQFSNLPEIAGSYLSSTNGAWAYMKFLNRASKKSAEYGLDVAMAIGKKDKRMFTNLLTRLATEAIYTTKAYHFTNKILNPDGDTKIDPLAFALTVYQPLVVLNMVLFDVFNKANKALYAKDEISIDSHAGVYNLFSDVGSSVLQNAGMSVAFFANFLLKAGATKEEKQALAPEDTDIAGSFVSNLLEVLGDGMRDRANRYNQIKIGGRTYQIQDYTSSDNAVNNVIGGSVTSTSIKAKKLVDTVNKSMYTDKGTSGISFDFIYASKDYDAIDRTNHKLMAELGVYDILNGKDIGKTLEDLQKSTDSKKLETVRGSLGNIRFDTSDDGETYYTKAEEVMNKQKTVFNKVVNMLDGYDVNGNPSDWTAEQGKTEEELKKQKELQTEIETVVLANKKKTTVFDSPEIQDIVNKYTGQMGQRIVYGTMLKGLVSGYEKNLKDQVSLELYGVKYSKVKVREQLDSIMVEISKRSRQYQFELIDQNIETIVSFNRDILPTIAKDYVDTKTNTQSNDSFDISNKLWMQEQVFQNEGLSYLGGTNNIRSFAMQKKLNQVGKMPEVTEEDKKKKTEAMQTTINSFSSISKNNYLSPGVRMGYSIALADNFSSIPVDVRASVAKDIEEYVSANSVSVAVDDSETKKKVYMDYKLFGTGTGSSSIPKGKMGDVAKKLNKAQEIKEDAMRFQNKDIGSTVTRYQVFGDSIMAVQTPVSKLKEEGKIQEWKYFDMPKPTVKEVDLSIVPRPSKTITKKYTPKTIKKYSKTKRK